MQLSVHEHQFANFDVIEVEETLTGDVVAWMCPSCYKRVRPFFAPSMSLENEANEAITGPVTWLDANVYVIEKTPPWWDRSDIAYLGFLLFWFAYPFFWIGIFL